MTFASCCAGTIPENTEQIFSRHTPPLTGDYPHPSLNSRDTCHDKKRANVIKGIAGTKDEILLLIFFFGLNAMKEQEG